MTQPPLNSDMSSESLFKEGCSLYASNEWSLSIDVLHRFLEREPLHFEAIHLSALALLRLQRYEDSIPLLMRALNLQPKHLPSLRNLAWVLLQLNRLEEAQVFAARRVEEDQESSDGLALLAQIQTQLGQLNEALQTFRTLSRLLPQSADVQNNMGLLLYQMAEHALAIDHYTQAQLLDPKNAQLSFNKAVSLEKLERWQEAKACYELAIVQDDQYRDAFFNLGLLHIHQDEYESAVQCFDRVLALDSKMPMAYLNKALALQKLKAFELAQASLEKAMALEPANTLISFNLATVLQDQRELAASAQMYEQVLLLDPTHLNAWCNLGDVFHDLQDPKRAIECYEKALSLDPDSVRAKYHLSLSCLLDAQYERAWPLFEWRRQYENAYLSHRNQAHTPPMPLWLGQQSLVGKRILVVSEQGLGDSIQFVRYASYLKDLGASVLLQVPRALKVLFETLDDVSQVLSTQEPWPECDFHVPMMSLPLALSSVVTSLPNRVPYLKAPVEEQEKWRHQLGTKTRPRVGLVWSGGVRLEQPWTWAVNQRRNIPLSQLRSLGHAGVEFVSLQKGAQAQQELVHLKASAWTGPSMIDWMDEVDDFSQTAALMEQLDLLISVDTSSAHLAAALGKPVWLLNRFDTCWRWQLERTDSPWYPTMKIYRQERLDDWGPVIERVRSDLMTLFALEPMASP